MGISNSELRTGNNVKAIMGKQIMEARNAIKLTRKTMAERLSSNILAPIENKREAEFSQDRLKQWEYGNNPVPTEWIPAICDVLDVDVGYLFGDYEEHKRVAADIKKETGLSEESIQKLLTMNAEDPKQALVLSACIEDSNFEYLLYLIGKRIQYTAVPIVRPVIETEDGKVHLRNAKKYLEYEQKVNIQIPFDGAMLPVRKKNLLDSLISTAVVDSMTTISTAFPKRNEQEANNGND